ncbi:hypothetical protein Taro_045223 [Colocasia esculenta]|uniref:non-specific serine/threonine protein kinase n=1 Tax=Colocasia esculenta TaxID=4460 RepID=A0A843X3W3_COLES|nr:hypothetical protein [Colocasia esculenta]
MFLLLVSPKCKQIRKRLPGRQKIGKIACSAEVTSLPSQKSRKSPTTLRNEIGKGRFGTVYLGFFNDRTQVAVKLLSQLSSQGSKEFQAEAVLLTWVHHKNLVSLLGYCHDERNLALIYEYMGQGSLQDHLSGKIDSLGVLSWEQRVKIAFQAAQGLDYLHNVCRPPIIHRDVKSSNILLDHDFIAKLTDFGLSRVFNDEKKTETSTAVVGTAGYLDPE